MAAGIPWDEIKAEYVAGNMSYADLSAEHDVALRAVEERGKNESWVALRREARGKTAAKLTDTISDAKIEKINKIVDQLLLQCTIASKQLTKRQKRVTLTEKLPDGGIRVTVRTESEDGRVVDIGNLKMLSETVTKLDGILRAQRLESSGGTADNTITVIFDSPEDI